MRLAEAVRDRPELARLLSPRLTRYVPHRPTPRQAAFLLLPHLEALYGGAAGGGKSDALLMGALQYVDVPGYAALLLRRTYADLSLPGALMERAEAWLSPTDARWDDRKKTWRFPSGATVTFGYLENERDKYRYQGAELQYIGFDELTQFSETQYRYLLSRVRRLKGSAVPLRVRSASNPGGAGHEWVKGRFVQGLGVGGRGLEVPGTEDSPTLRRIFVPARLADNPHLDAGEYERALSELDPVTRKQLLDGDWTVRTELGFFRREWFPVVERAPEGLRWVRFWDAAAKANLRSCYWAGAKVGLGADGRYWIGDMVRGRWEYPEAKRVILQTAAADGRGVALGIEDSSSGTAVLQDLRRDPSAGGLQVWPVTVTQDKVTRAAPWASRAHGGLVSLVSGAWVGAFLDELDGFPSAGVPDDQVDAVSGAYQMLAGKRRLRFL